jgi:organic radical activating enzyme
MKDISFENNPKFVDRLVTADGQNRASVALSNPETLWFNTGTLCNIECSNCYIASSPTNDDLVYLTIEEVEAYLQQLSEIGWGVTEIGVTGGEPFMNPDILGILRSALKRGYDVLVLTNAMVPMMRPSVQRGLQDLHAEFGDKLTLRVSLDHYQQEKHDQERGTGSFVKTITGMSWLRDTGIKTAVAGRVEFAESEQSAREGYAELFKEFSFSINAYDPSQTVLFPEMDVTVDVPEITTACWGILGKSPEDVMCASSRMVVKRKGQTQPTVLACTLIAYDQAFELGHTLKEAEQDVYLNHPHCAKFCVLGGASCSA